MLQQESRTVVVSPGPQHACARAWRPLAGQSSPRTDRLVQENQTSRTADFGAVAGPAYLRERKEGRSSRSDWTAPPRGSSGISSRGVRPTTKDGDVGRRHVGASAAQRGGNASTGLGDEEFYGDVDFEPGFCFHRPSHPEECSGLTLPVGTYAWIRWLSESAERCWLCCPHPRRTWRQGKPSENRTYRS